MALAVGVHNHYLRVHAAALAREAEAAADRADEDAPDATIAEATVVATAAETAATGGADHAADRAPIIAEPVVLDKSNVILLGPTGSGRWAGGRERPWQSNGFMRATAGTSTFVPLNPTPSPNPFLVMNKWERD
jgi:hypothetical protein